MIELSTASTEYPLLAFFFAFMIGYYCRKITEGFKNKEAEEKNKWENVQNILNGLKR